MTPRIHAKEIRAFADSYEIEHLTKQYGWVVEQNPAFYSDEKYRIMPEPKPVIVRTANVYFRFTLGRLEIEELAGAGANTKFTFDGKTGECLNVEKI